MGPKADAGDRSPAVEGFVLGPATHTHGSAKKNEIPLFLFRVKLESPERLEKEASLVLR